MFALCNALETVKQMLKCSNDMLYWIIHNVCNESIRVFLTDMVKGWGPSPDMEDDDVLPHIIRELLNRFVTEEHRLDITNGYFEPNMLVGESFTSFWERLKRLQKKYCLATGVAIDNTVFKRNMLKGIQHRDDLLDEATEQPIYR